MQIYQSGHYDSNGTWVDDEIVLLGVGSSFSADRRESDDSPTTKVTGTVTASASHNGDVIVEYEGGGDEVVASLRDDNTDLPHSHDRLLPNTMFENVQFGPPAHARAGRPEPRPRRHGGRRVPERERAVDVQPRQRLAARGPRFPL